MPEIVDSRTPREVKDYGDFQPTLDRILVRQIKSSEQVSGFNIPERFRQHSNWGEVVALGEFVVLGGERVPLTEFVNVGDRLRFGQYNAEEFSVDDPDLWIVRIQDVRGVRRLIRG